MTDPAMALDAILKIIELVSLIGGGGFALFKVGRTTQRFEEIVGQQANEIRELKNNIKELSALITSNALLDQRVTAMSDRMNRLDGRMDELAHGEGFVMPLIKRIPSAG